MNKASFRRKKKCNLTRPTEQGLTETRTDMTHFLTARLLMKKYQNKTLKPIK